MRKKKIENKKNREFIAKYECDRNYYKSFLHGRNPLFMKLEAQSKLNLLPRKSSITRAKNICILTGRSRGVYKHLGLSRIKFREMASCGLLPGIKKASW